MNRTGLRQYMLAAAIAVSALVAAQAATSPNLLVVMCDDLGYADVGFNGCTDIPTPNIDRIATGGVKCASGYVAYPVCGPSRAGFITGRYEQRFGFERNPQYRPDDPNMGLPLSERTIAEVLKPAGYRSGVIGKWHLGAHPTLHPLSRGFDFFFGHLGGGHRYFPEELTIQDSYSVSNETDSYRTWILRNHQPVQITRYLTDEFSDAAVAFVEASKDQPFFLFLSYNAPHLPLQATEEYLARFPDIRDPTRRTYAAMISAVDDGVGRVLDALERLQLEQDTLVFFLSDNGGPSKKNGSRNTPLQGGKGDVWEGGFRVPYAVRWPGRLPAGVTYDRPVSSLDILATIAALAGAPEDPERPRDGVNLVPYLTGEKPGAPHDTIYLRKFDSRNYALRHGDYKFIRNGNVGTQGKLFNLADDIGEKNNLVGSFPEQARQCEDLLQAWVAELIEPRFLGLIHTEEWQEKVARENRSKAGAKPAAKPTAKPATEWDWFGAQDTDADGQVTEAEWLSWAKQNAARKDKAFSEEAQRKFYQARDTDGNGHLTREELEAGN